MEPNRQTDADCGRHLARIAELEARGAENARLRAAVDAHLAQFDDHECVACDKGYEGTQCVCGEDAIARQPIEASPGPGGGAECSWLW